MNHSQFDFLTLYAHFQSPVTAIDCGQHCAPYNELGVPFCCDRRHTIPSAYLTEWDYLRTSTDLWHRWVGRDREETVQFQSLLPDGQVIIACQGHKLCNRQFRSLVCRAFPFFPYITVQGQFIGLTYFWEYADRCWVINNLQYVLSKFVSEFIDTFDEILCILPQEREFSLPLLENASELWSATQKHTAIPS